MSLCLPFVKRFACVAAIVPFALLTGCAMNSSGGDLAANATVGGVAMGGRQPVSSAAVSFYATGTSGYGSTATLLGSATTDANGVFTITRNANTCSDPQQVYLVASGGNPGSGTNTASVLVEALGKCSAITSSTNGLVINELTTVAAAYALQGFADTTVNIGTSSTNAQGLTHAFANAANLVTLNGLPLSTTPGGNGTVPTVVLNTLGDILASCVNSSGPTSTPCSTILLGAPSAVGAATPSNVWQEALNIARYPAYQTAALYGAASASGPYQSTLGTQPNDLSIGIAYSAGFETNGTTAATFPWDIKADSTDNIWVSGMTSAAVAELSPAGTLLSPSSGGWGSSTLQTVFTRGLAFDTTTNGNLWAADATGNIWEYTPAGTATVPTQGTTTQYAETTVLGPVAIGVDSGNNVWFGTYGTASASQGFGEIVKGASSATFPSNSAYSTASTKGTYTLFVDAANGNNLYAGSQTAGVVYEYLSPTAAATATTSLGTAATNGLAVDKNKNLWVVYTGSGSNGGSLLEYASGATTPTLTCKPTVTTGTGLYNPRGIAIDGNNRMFVTSYTAATIIEFDPSIGTGCDATSDVGTFFTTSIGSGIDPVNSAGTGIIEASAARNITIDSSGAFWTINGNSTAGYQPVVQILGIAAPVNPVLAAGKYGVKP